MIWKHSMRTRYIRTWCGCVMKNGMKWKFSLGVKTLILHWFRQLHLFKIFQLQVKFSKIKCNKCTLAHFPFIIHSVIIQTPNFHENDQKMPDVVKYLNLPTPRSLDSSASHGQNNVSWVIWMTDPLFLKSKAEHEIKSFVVQPLFGLHIPVSFVHTLSACSSHLFSPPRQELFYSLGSLRSEQSERWLPGRGRASTQKYLCFKRRHISLKG